VPLAALALAAGPAAAGTTVPASVSSSGETANDVSANVVGFDPLLGITVPGGPSSDPGDLLPGLDGAAKANFGFNVKHLKATSIVPGGAFQFCYTAEKLHLRSASFDWLVVTSTNWARFEGLATIDGAAGALYPFRIDARDGAPDRLVLRVWAPGADPSTAEPVYKASGDVSGGQVTITGKGGRDGGVPLRRRPSDWRRLRCLQDRIRSPFGSKSGSRATSPATHPPKISTSTAVPTSAAAAGRYA
jgi:hypothetical protein